MILKPCDSLFITLLKVNTIHASLPHVKTLTYTSNIAAKVAVMNDLFCVSVMRGCGIVRKLVEHCREYAKASGATRLQWITAPNNKKA